MDLNVFEKKLLGKFSVLEIIVKIIFLAIVLFFFVKFFLFFSGKKQLLCMPLFCVLAFLTIDFKKDDKNYFYILFPIFCFLLYSLWALVQPFNSCPDEYMRYDVCKYIYEYNKLPRGDDPLIRNPIWGFSYAFLPFIGQIFSAFFMKLFDSFLEPEKLFMAARIPSILFSTMSVVLFGKIGRKVFEERYAKLFVIVASLLPEFIFISSYINLDSMGVFAVTLIFYCFLLAEDNEWGVRHCVFLGISVAICVLSYMNAYAMIFTALIFAIVSVVKNQNIENNKKLKFILTRIGIVLIPVIILSSWWFIRNAILYNGDFLGFKTSRDCCELYGVPELKPSNRTTPNKLGYSLWYMLYNQGWISSTVNSFVARFGYMNIFGPEYIYMFFYFIFFVGLVSHFQNNDSIVKIKSYKLMTFVLCFITISLTVYNSYFTDFQPQGRYIMPMLVGFVYLVVSGWRTFLFYARKIKVGKYIYMYIEDILIVLIIFLLFFSSLKISFFIFNYYIRE